MLSVEPDKLLTSLNSGAMACAQKVWNGKISAQLDCE